MSGLLDRFSSLTQKEKADFADFFMERYLRSDFGVISKREIELILIQGIKESGLIRGMANYDVSALLGLNERRLKGLLLDAAIKYEANTLKGSIKFIINSLIVKDIIKFDHENGYITFSLEDPIVRRDFDNELRKLGYFSDSSFRSDIVKVKDSSFLAFLYHHHNYTYDDFAKRLESNKSTGKDLTAVITGKGSWKNRFEKGFKKLQDGKDKVDFIVSAVKLLKSIILI